MWVQNKPKLAAELIIKLREWWTPTAQQRRSVVLTEEQQNIRRRTKTRPPRIQLEDDE